jgi:hypothetical protein
LRITSTGAGCEQIKDTSYLLTEQIMGCVPDF